MNVLEGLCYINDIDIYKEYGVFLCEKKEGEFSNYEELLKPAAAKSQLEVDFNDRDGVELPPKLNIVLQPRDVKLYFALYAPSPAAYFSKLSAFFNLLRYKAEGETAEAGWLKMQFKEINKTFKMYYLAPEDFEQLTPLKGGVGTRFHLKFREPKPEF